MAAAPAPLRTNVALPDAPTTTGTDAALRQVATFLSRRLIAASRSTAVLADLQTAGLNASERFVSLLPTPGTMRARASAACSTSSLARESSHSAAVAGIGGGCRMDDRCCEPHTASRRGPRRLWRSRCRIRDFIAKDRAAMECRRAGIVVRSQPSSGASTLRDGLGEDQVHVFEVWDSEEAHQEHSGRLFAALQGAGVDAGIVSYGPLHSDIPD